MFDISKCDFCGECLEKCQYQNYDKEEGSRQIKALTKGQKAEILSECITCFACNEYCPKGANPFDLISEYQEKWKLIPDSDLILSMLDQMINDVPNEVIWGNLNKPALSLCAYESLLPQDAIKGRLFDDLTVIKGSKYFCWIGLAHIGRQTPIKENAQAFIENLAEVGVKEIIFVHDDCYAMLVKKIRDYNIELPFRPVHIFSYLLDFLKSNQNFVTKINKKIAYQRPCASRYTPEKEWMLDEIFDLIGVERVDRRYDRENALCCGGPLMDIDQGRLNDIQDRNLNDAKEHGADAMVYLCPVCYTFMNEITHNYGMSSIFLTNLCRIALGEEPFPS